MVRIIYLSLLLLVFSMPKAMAVGKFDFLGGFLSLSAKTETAQGSVSGPGSYVAIYHYHFFDRIDFSVGYSLFLTKGIGGSLGYGPDLGFTYYPMTFSGPIQIQTDRIVMNYRDSLRPLLSFSFHQRQVQTVDSAYAGFGLGAGAEYHWNERFDLKGLFRYQLLSGPQSSTANYMDLIFGVSFGI